VKQIVLPEKVIKVMRKFADNKAEIFVVGGAVRDMLLEKSVKDWDFTTNLTPDEMKKLFPKNSFYNNNFGTFSIVVAVDDIFEVTTLFVRHQLIHKFGELLRLWPLAHHNHRATTTHEPTNPE